MPQNLPKGKKTTQADSWLRRQPLPAWQPGSWAARATWLGWGGASKKAKKAKKATKPVIYKQKRQKIGQGSATKPAKRQKLPRQSAKQPARVSQPAS